MHNKPSDKYLYNNDFIMNNVTYKDYNYLNKLMAVYNYVTELMNKGKSNDTVILFRDAFDVYYFANKNEILEIYSKSFRAMNCLKTTKSSQAWNRHHQTLIDDVGSWSNVSGCRFL